MISIVIIVKNDLRIKSLLDKLKIIKYSIKTEIIVVDASSKNLKIDNKKYPDVNFINYYAHSGKKTYSEQRNLGIKNANGNIIAFIDADCIPEENWLINLTKPLILKNEKITSGACKSFPNNTIFKEEKFGNYRNEAPTMNMAFTKAVFEDVGYFDEKMEGAEDSDLCIRAIKKGYKIRYIKNAIIYHDWGNFNKNLERSFNAGKDRVKLYKKHKGLFKLTSSNNLYTIYYVCFLTFLPISILFLPYIFILFLPSIIKKRNPIKEFYNISYAVGFVKQALL